jgi:hypothetical protein
LIATVQSTDCTITNIRPGDPKAEPQQRDGQHRQRRQRVENCRQRGQHDGAEPDQHRQRDEHHGAGLPENISNPLSNKNFLDSPLSDPSALSSTLRKWIKSADDIFATIERFCVYNTTT